VTKSGARWLPDEPEAGVEDIHYHVFEPREVRVSVSYSL